MLLVVKEIFTGLWYDDGLYNVEWQVIVGLLVSRVSAQVEK